MKKVFKDFAAYVRAHDGYRKPKIDFQKMYALFPNFDFLASERFGQYENFGKAYEQKIYDMVVVDEKGNECYMVYREYGDTDENLAYVL